MSIRVGFTSLAAVAVLLNACAGDDSVSSPIETSTGADTGTTGAPGVADGGSASGPDMTQAPSGQLATVVFAFQPAGVTACVKVTDERGVFAEHGIAMEFAPPPAGPSGATAQVLTGQITAAPHGVSNIVSAIGAGVPIVVTSGMAEDFDVDGQTDLALVVGPDSGIGSFEDLHGKKIAVSSLSGAFEVLLREAMEIEGGDYSQIELVPVPFADQVAAMTSGRVDAVFTLQPFVAQLIAEGGVSLGDPQAIAFGKSDVTSSAIFMAREFVDANPEVVESFTDALAEGSEWCNSHPDEMKQAIARLTNVPQELIDRTPMPVYAVGVDADETETWGELLVKHGVGDLTEAPPADQVLWSGAPQK